MEKIQKWASGSLSTEQIVGEFNSLDPEEQRRIIGVVTGILGSNELGLTTDQRNALTNLRNVLIRTIQGLPIESDTTPTPTPTPNPETPYEIDEESDLYKTVERWTTDIIIEVDGSRVA